MVGARVVDEDEEPQLVTLVEGCAPRSASVCLRSRWSRTRCRTRVPSATTRPTPPWCSPLACWTGSGSSSSKCGRPRAGAREAPRHRRLLHGGRHPAPGRRLTGSDTWLHRALGHGREYRADQLAVAAVRYPPGLHDALAALSDPPAVVEPASVFSPESSRRRAGSGSTRWPRRRRDPPRRRARRCLGATRRAGRVLTSERRVFRPSAACAGAPGGAEGSLSRTRRAFDSLGA